MGLLGDYTEVMASSRASPLLRYFALQCQYCLEVQPQSYEIVVLRNRISSYLEEIPGSQITNNKAAGESSLLASVTDINSDRSHIIGKLNAREMPFLELESYPQSADANTMQMPYATPASNIENLTTDKPYVPPSLGEADALDELFEELVTSIPSARYPLPIHLATCLVANCYRLEPEFAHNLGFYAGDLDTDFMTQLQRSPNG